MHNEAQSAAHPQRLNGDAAIFQPNGVQRALAEIDQRADGAGRRSCRASAGHQLRYAHRGSYLVLVRAAIRKGMAGTDCRMREGVDVSMRLSHWTPLRRATALRCWISSRIMHAWLCRLTAVHVLAFDHVEKNNHLAQLLTRRDYAVGMIGTSKRGSHAVLCISDHRLIRSGQC